MSELTAQKMSAIVPNDATQFSATSGLWVGVAGNIAIEVADPALVPGSASIVVPVPQGRLPVSVRRVLATGTTASSIFALY